MNFCIGTWTGRVRGYRLGGKHAPFIPPTRTFVRLLPRRCGDSLLPTKQMTRVRMRFTAARAFAFLGLLFAAASLPLPHARAEAMLEIFQLSWHDLAQKMPEIAEAGYTSLWLPPPCKAGSVYSVGYDLFDPFDLGDKNQRGTIATRWGTKADLLELMQVAHRFGIRVYFDNIMNHRGFDVPGYDANTPTNLYPGLLPQDFHVQTVSGGFYRNWPNVQDWNNQWDVQYESLSGLLDLANEPGPVNGNYGPALGGTISKPVFVRHPQNPEYYLDPNGPALGGPWHPFYTTTGTPVADDVNSYLIRSAMWILNTTKCDGFRLDAVKHVPSDFFGAVSSSPQTDDPGFSGYTGGIQAMYDYVHGYGSNVLGNGYLETDGNRNSVFDTEVPRNDAMLFGEHLGPPPTYQEYLNKGMRLLNTPLRSQLDAALGGSAGLWGMDQRDYIPANGAFSAAMGVQLAQDQDQALCCVNHREMHNAYYFMHEGLPMIYSDNYNWAGPPSDPSTFPIVPYANYLGEFGDNTMPETCYLHHQLARGGTRPRWSDQNIVAFERYDYRDVDPATAYTNADATVVLFAMNDNYGFPGDVLFDDGVSRAPDGYYSCNNGSPSRGCGLGVGFPPGSVLAQLATTSPGGGDNRACAKLLVHGATTNLAQAQATANDPNPVNRLIYVNTTPPPGGGAIEFLVPSGGWVMYGYQWPEPSRANVLTSAITFRQAGQAVPSITVYRHDGTNGDPNFSPIYPFKMRGSVDATGAIVLAPGEGNIPTMTNTYAIQIPVLTNGSFDINVRADASAANILIKMDGGLDLNSQMGLGPLSGPDLRDNRPGYATDVFLGYEQALEQFRLGPEKFAARIISRNNLVSLGAETYYYTVGGADTAVNGAGTGNGLNTDTANWVYHDPAAPVTVLTNAALPVAPPTQMVPTNPAANASVDLWVKVGNYFQTNHCFIYFTTDGSNPEGAFGVGKGTTQVVPAVWVNHDAADPSVDWFRGTILGSNQLHGVQVRYKIAVYQDTIPAISDADPSKLYGLTQFCVTNFDPTATTVWLHNDLNPGSTTVGLATGFHIVRARAFLPRSGKSGVFNTFLQTFYYDAGPPGGVIAFPPSDGTVLTDSTYQIVVRADENVTGVEFNILDSDPGNDDGVTGQHNGNGLTNGVPVYAAATAVTPDPTLSQQYPGLPQEFRFDYVSVPTNGPATLTVRLKTLASAAYPNRATTLTRSVFTMAPPNVLYLSNPAAEGMALLLGSNSTYLIQGCFTPTLTTNNTSLFSLSINGVAQPASSLFLRPPGAVAGCPGLRSILYSCNQTNFIQGSNTVQLSFTNGIQLTTTRHIFVAVLYSPVDSDGDGMPDWQEIIAGTNPYDSNSVLRITGLANESQLSWRSVSNISYQVVATTNLLYPMSVISPVIRASEPMTFWTDPAPDAVKRFYRIQVVP